MVANRGRRIRNKTDVVNGHVNRICRSGRILHRVKTDGRDIAARQPRIAEGGKIKDYQGIVICCGAFVSGSPCGCLRNNIRVYLRLCKTSLACLTEIYNHCPLSVCSIRRQSVDFITKHEILVDGWIRTARDRYREFYPRVDAIFYIDGKRTRIVAIVLLAGATRGTTTNVFTFVPAATYEAVVAVRIGGWRIYACVKTVSVVLEGCPDIVSAVSATRVMREDDTLPAADAVGFRTRIRLCPRTSHAEEHKNRDERQQARHPSRTGAYMLENRSRSRSQHILLLLHCRFLNHIY